jgi:osmotically-inducible protein OsmY
LYKRRIGMHTLGSQPNWKVSWAHFLILVLFVSRVASAYQSCFFTKSSPALVTAVNGIARAVETALADDDGVSPYAIAVHVEATEGIVILQGAVDNPLAKDRAVAIAQTTEGVRSVIDLVRVVAQERSDSEIRRAVQTTFGLDPRTDSYKIDVRVTQGMVTLRGTVDSSRAKLTCGGIAKTVRGVKELVNNLVVGRQPSRPDASVRSEIKSRLRGDVLVGHSLIAVSVDRGNVRLEGTAGSRAEKARLAAHCWVAGVRSVHEDAVTIRRWARDTTRRPRKRARIPDRDIKRAIRDGFLYDPRVVVQNLRITVRNGKVTIAGSVRDTRTKNAAGDTARNTVGVTKLRNRLQVGKVPSS